MTLRLLGVSTACTIKWPSTKAEPSANRSTPVSNQPLKHNNATRLLAIPNALPKLGQELLSDTLTPPMLCGYRDPLSLSKKDMAAKLGDILKERNGRSVSSGKRVAPLPLPKISL